MNINNTEEIQKLSLNDFFQAVASETEPTPVYEDGKVLEPHKFTALGDINYADAKMVLNIRSDIRNNLIKEYPEFGIRVGHLGDSVCFGSYPQRDGKGADSLEWIVLAKEGRKLLLVSKYAIDCQPYHNVYESVSWETASIRKWLNDEFLNRAFTKEERMMIPYTTVQPDKNDNVTIYGNHGGNTLDKIFLLSATEAKLYFADNQKRVCAGTEIAGANGAHLNSDDKSCWWWLRTPGWNPMNYTQTFANDFGEVKMHGDLINHTDNAVRPAMWLGLD